MRMNPDGTHVDVIGHNFRNSYEQTITSFGDVFQNDNDDPPACRTSFLMEYGNAGYFSLDGLRTWNADKRPGQDVPTAEWRQDDPATIPAGDVYGGGAPTGIVSYEGDAFGEKWRGLLLSCEAARNTIFSYLPKADGAGYALDRSNFLTTNQEQKFEGVDFNGGDKSITGEIKTYFRPSDVAVGPDGAIYRIAPKGFKSVVPKFNLTTTEGQLTALKSPAVNVRALGETGLAKVEATLNHPDPQMRIAAFRALRRAHHQVLRHAAKLATDPSPAVRREVAIALRDVSFAEAKGLLLTLAKGYDGKDRAYLAAIGIGASSKEAAFYTALASTQTDLPSKNRFNRRLYE